MSSFQNCEKQTPPVYNPLVYGSLLQQTHWIKTDVSLSTSMAPGYILRADAKCCELPSKAENSNGAERRNGNMVKRLFMTLWVIRQALFNLKTFSSLNAFSNSEMRYLY